MSSQPEDPGDLSVLERRPAPGEPRSYQFPRFTRHVLADGLTVLRAHVPGRPLLQAQLIVRGDAGGGAVSEPAGQAGVSVLMARAMPEGTAHRDGVELVEAAERLGAELGADAGWDSLSAHVEVPRSRLTPALALLAELALEPSFPEREVQRLRDERLNDLRQAMADPRRHVERAFAEVIYAPDAAYARPSGGTEASVAALGREALVERHRALMRPEHCTLIISGDLEGVPVDEAVAEAFGDWGASVEAHEASDAGGEVGGGAPEPAAPDRPGRRRVVIVDRPGAPQSEVRVGHVGRPRRIPDFHALSVMNTLLGGLFNSRLNRLLREERGYTYGVSSAFDLRRAAGPFAVRCAVESDVTVEAVGDVIAELRRIREAPVEAVELATARDYLVGVFPLRFETSAHVAAALAGLVVHELPDDELDRYRPSIAAVTADEVLAAAVRHIDPERASIVIVGDADKLAARLRKAGLGRVQVVRDHEAEASPGA
jgi:zinc protease